MMKRFRSRLRSLLPGERRLPTSQTSAQGNVYERERGDILQYFGLDYLETQRPDVGERASTARTRRKFRPTLVDIGQNVGRSRVKYSGANLPLHLITKDFFISVVQLDTMWLFLIVIVAFVSIFFFWSIFWYLMMRNLDGCFSGPSERYVDALLFSVVTQMTIGYGNTSPDSCWAATWVVMVQSVIAIVLDAVTLGIIFARISHPHQRSRSIFISNRSIIARRDGILKFMFRVADIRNAQVVEPKVRAYLYTWGEGRISAEGERIPVRVEPIELDYIDGMLLLPLIIEHTIDERSPLCGHTYISLVQMNAEIVVTFEGTTEMGNPFMARRSYIPQEIFWGFQFQNVVKQPATSEDPYEVDLNLFHSIEPQKDLPELSQGDLSLIIVNRAKRTVPYPLLGENTLVLSDNLCVAPNEDGLLCLYCRVGDTYPNQMLEISARMFLYRWKDLGETSIATAPEGESFQQYVLQCGYTDGSDRLYLRLPSILVHIIDTDSPLASWREPGGIDADARSEIVVVLNAYMNVNTHNILRQRTYTVRSHVKYGYGFSPMVRHPELARDRKPRIRWQYFHEMKKIEPKFMEKFPPPPGLSNPNASVSGGLAAAPESHANVGSKISMSGYKNSDQEKEELENDVSDIPMGLERYRTNPTTSLTEGTSKKLQQWMLLRNYSRQTSDAGNSLPPPAALHPSLPGKERFRETDYTEEDVAKNDFTVQAMDLHRYSAAIGYSDSIPKSGSLTFTPLPTDFKSTTAKAQEKGETDEEASNIVLVSKEEGRSGLSTGNEPEESSKLPGMQPIIYEANEPDEDAGPIHFVPQESTTDGRTLKAFASLLRHGSSQVDHNLKEENP